jgi:Mor family transcriptional regulator
MKAHELLSFNKELLGKIAGAGIRHDDYKHIELYNEYSALKERGEKVTYIVAHLSDKYRLSERFIYAFVARMKKEVTAYSIQQQVA